jgi:hypothetical protein
MNIAAFLSDGDAMHQWLESERSAMDLRGEYLSWWSHDEGPGFGLVVVGAERSMEMHLMRDGSVQRLLEEFDSGTQQFVTLLADSPSRQRSARRVETVMPRCTWRPRML